MATVQRKPYCMIPSMTILDDWSNQIGARPPWLQTWATFKFKGHSHGATPTHNLARMDPYFHTAST